MIDIEHINAEGTALRKHQLKMLEILVKFDEICSKNDINYWLSGGTLLGAVRHKGFIPWDDDLDIVLLKKDLLKLHHLILRDKNFPYELQANDTDFYYIAPYEKLRMPGTRIKENNNNDKYYKYNGIYIDLFFLEPAGAWSHFVANKLQRLLMLIANGRKFPGKKYLIRSFYLLHHKLIIPILGKLSLLIAPNYLSYPMGSFFTTQFDINWIFPLKKLEFENRIFPVPNNYHEVLKAQYGDYMKLPSINKIEYHTCSVKFNI